MLLLVTTSAGFLAGCAAPNRLRTDSWQPQQQVTQPTAGTPLANVCHLSVHRLWAGFYRTSFNGSAVLYRGRYLLTAGHNVLSSRTRVDYIDVRCGVLDARDSAGPMHQRIAGTEMLAASGYHRAPFERDFGVIRLNRPIDTGVETLLAEETAAPAPVILSGYPGGFFSGRDLFSTAAPTVRADGEMLWYTIQTYKGNSGGPVWRLSPSGQVELAAIHVREGGGGRIVNRPFREEVERLIGLLDTNARQRGD